jgi:F-type H+-transporting ATPase subunit b
MQIDWTTFALEVLNFLVLVWILKRFLYRPVLAVLDARQARVKAETDASRQLRAEAEALKGQYESRLADWDKEKAQARRQLEEELARERAARLENLKKSLADETAKGHAREQSLGVAREAALAREALAQSYGAAAAMLRRMASEDMTRRIAQVFREDLATLPEPDLAALRNAALALDVEATAEIAAAHPLDEAMRGALADALSQAAGRRLHLGFKDAPELIAGLRAGVGACLLHANLADELEFFRRAEGHG